MPPQDQAGRLTGLMEKRIGMAEDEERRDGSKRSGRRDPARNVRRDPPLIEGQAQDVTPEVESSSLGHAVSAPEEPSVTEGAALASEAHAADVAHEPAAAAVEREPDASGFSADTFSPSETSSTATQASEPVRQESRSQWGTLAAIGFVVLAAGLLYLFYQISSLPPDNSAAVTDLRTRLSALEARPPTSTAGLGDRITKVEGEIGNIQGGLDTLGKRVDGIAAAATAQPDVAGKVAELQTNLNGVKSELTALTATVAAIPRPDMGHIETRIGDMDQRLSGLQSAVSGIPHVDLGPLTGKVDAIETRLKPIEAETEAARSPDQIAQRRAAPVAVTAQAITGAIEAGQAFPKEFRALQALGADPAKLAPLQAVADAGAPSLRDLQTSLAEAGDRIVARGAAPASGSYMDRLMAGASGLVQVRPLGSVVGDTPAAIVARMNDDIGNDDLAAVLTEWHKLPEASQSASKALADRVKLRLDAEQAAKAIAANAIEAMAATRS